MLTLLLTMQSAMQPPTVVQLSPACATAWLRMNTTMHQANAMYELNEKQCLTRCIPPRADVGKTCRSICSDGSDQAVKVYASQCEHEARGVTFYEDYDMRWAATQKLLSTSGVRCLPVDCLNNATDVPILANATSKAFCATMGAYPFDSCEVHLVQPPFTLAD